VPRSPSRQLCSIGILAALLVGMLVALASSASAQVAPWQLSASLELGQLGPAADALTAKPIIGVNDAAGWGPEPAQTILAGHITWNRVEVNGPYNTLASSLSDGFKNLAIVNNVNDETPLSAVEPRKWGAGVVAELKANPGIEIAEAGNESYLKGGVANPVQYGRMYLAAVEDMQAAGVHIPLLFNMTGNIPLGSWAAPAGRSEDAHNGGWLRDAVNAVPGLASAIVANGVSTHPYGAVGENTGDDSGTAAVAAQEAVAGTVLGSIPTFYVTEFGYALHRCGETIGACSKPEQARKLQAAYEVFLADPHIAGLWWYQSHDEGGGDWGIMSKRNAKRPSFKTLSAIAQSVGQ
jgi:hypothetical protein